MTDGVVWKLLARFTWFFCHSAGILTTGSPSTDHYVKSYKVEYRERNRWKPYTQYNSSEPLVRTQSTRLN